MVNAEFLIWLRQSHIWQLVNSWLIIFDKGGFNLVSLVENKLMEK